MAAGKRGRSTKKTIEMKSPQSKQSGDGENCENGARNGEKTSTQTMVKPSLPLLLGDFLPPEMQSTERDASVCNPSSSKVQAFTYQALADATENFQSSCFCVFDQVYKGRLVDSSEVVMIKKLNGYRCKDFAEFVVDVLTLSQVDHPYLLKLIGYCAEHEKRLLVSEYMPLGCLASHLHGDQSNQKALDWNTRMKIADEVARGIEYLHEMLKPPIVNHHLKASNILLSEGYHPKISDFGLAQLYKDSGATGEVTVEVDIYNFGVVLLEIIMAKKAIDYLRVPSEANLVHWVRPKLKDEQKLSAMVDPLLEGRYPVRELYKAFEIAGMCVRSSLV